MIFFIFSIFLYFRKYHNIFQACRQVRSQNDLKIGTPFHRWKVHFCQRSLKKASSTYSDIRIANGLKCEKKDSRWQQTGVSLITESKSELSAFSECKLLVIVT